MMQGLQGTSKRSANSSVDTLRAAERERERACARARERECV